MDKHDKNLKSEHKVHLKGSGPFQVQLQQKITHAHSIKVQIWEGADKKIIINKYLKVPKSTVFLHDSAQLE